MIHENEVHLYEAHIPRFLNEHKGTDSDPKNSDYRLKSLQRDENNMPTPHTAEAPGGTWTFREAHDFTKLCVKTDVPDVNQRISGNVINKNFKHEVPAKTR